jgi:hypothetical protein
LPGRLVEHRRFHVFCHVVHPDRADRGDPSFSADGKSAHSGQGGAADDLSEQGRTLLELTATPAAKLLGAVSMILRSMLFGEVPAWVDL